MTLVSHYLQTSWSTGSAFIAVSVAHRDAKKAVWVGGISIPTYLLRYYY